MKYETGSSTALQRRHLKKSVWCHISALGGPIWMSFDSFMQNIMRITAIWSKAKPEVQFQYGGRLFFPYGSNYISAVNWVMSTKFGSRIDFDIPKTTTSTNTKPELVSSHGWRTAAILKIVKSPYLNKIIPFLWNLGVWRPDAWADFVEIGMVKFHYAADVSAWGGCHGNAHCVTTAQSKFYSLLFGRQNCGSHLAPPPHMLLTCCHINGRCVATDHWKYCSWWRLDDERVNLFRRNSKFEW